MIISLIKHVFTKTFGNSTKMSDTNSEVACELKPHCVNGQLHAVLADGIIECPYFRAKHIAYIHK